MNCTCCGFEIQGKVFHTDNGKKQVCEKCWDDSAFFFPEKAKTDNRYKVLSEIAEQNRNSRKSIEVSVLRLSQKNIDLYIGKMKSKDLLKIYEIDKFKDEELEGYQREQSEDRTSELIEYLTECPIAVMPSLFVSVRNAKFKQLKGDLGVLEIPKVKGSIWIIDGQHRISGFEKIYQKFTYLRNPNDLSVETFETLMDYELPLVFIDTQRASETPKFANNHSTIQVLPEDLERAIFFVVNKTQKGISSSLKDALLYRLNVSGIEGIPAIRKEKWRIQASSLGIALNRELDSPLHGLINIGGKLGTRKPIQLNSFVSSLEVLMGNNDFSELDSEIQMKFLKNYWNSVKNMAPEAFSEESWRKYMLLKSIGIYCLHWLALDVFHICLKNNLPITSQQTLDNIVCKISPFEWKTDTSPLSTLGGLKGAKRGYEKLKSYLV